MSDPLEQCPYDESHRILRSRMAFHLTRCSRQHRNEKKKVCPFDVRHILDPKDYKHHVDNCPSRESVLNNALQDEEGVGKLQKHTNILPVPLPGMFESIVPHDNNGGWNDYPDMQSYNPNANMESKPILMQCIGGSKAEKRRFREEQRRRIQKLENDREREDKQRREKERLQKEKQEQKRARAQEKDKEAEESVLLHPKKESESMALNQSQKENSRPAEENKTEQFMFENQNESDWVVVGKPKYVSTERNGAIPKKPANNKKASKLPKQSESKGTNSTTKAPFSYAAALNKSEDVQAQSTSQTVNTNSSTIEQEDNDKENDDSYFTPSTSRDHNISNENVDKVTKKVDKIVLEEEGFQVVTRKQNKKQHSAKQNAGNTSKKGGAKFPKSQ